MKDCPSPHVRCKTPASTARPTTPVLESQQLFGDAHEVIIEHLGVEYRLRQTRNGKLLLYK